MSMSGRLFLSAVLLLSAAGLAQAEDILDAKLNALKKKVQRRTYSTAATLNDQNLIVPQGATEEEKALDKKIREMEKEAVSAPGMISRQVPPLRSVSRPRTEQESSANWLTPALLSEITGGDDSQQEADGDSWIIEELNRQKTIQQEKLNKEEEKKLVEQRLKGQLQLNPSTASTPLNTYGEALQNIISVGPANPFSTPSYLESARSVYSRSEEPARNSEPATPLKSSVFSTSEPRESTFPARRPSSASRLSEFKTSPNRTPSTTPPSGQTPSWETPEEPFRQRVRRTAPGYEDDPFEENPLPGLKKNFWE